MLGRLRKTELVVVIWASSLAAACGGAEAPELPEAPVAPVDAGAAAPDASTPAPTPNLSLDPPALDFGVLRPGADSELELYIRSTGSAPSSLSIGPGPGFDAATFSFELDRGVVAPGAAATLRVRFSPSAAGSYSSRLELATNVPGREQVVIELTGESSTPFVSLSVDALDFGDVATGSSRTQVARLTNEGEAEAEVELRGEGEAAACASPGPVAFCARPRSRELDATGRFLIAPGEALPIEVSFAPSTPGQESAGALTFRTCPERRCEVRLRLTGRSLEPSLRCSPARLDFGPSLPGTWSEREVSCTPAGDGAVTVTGWMTTQSSFRLSPPQTRSLAPGESIEVGVACCDRSAGGSGNLRIFTEGSPQYVDVPLASGAP